ncbi:MAG TPA: hypothetical protein VF105_12955 [Gemmatimonadaceae bacterium]
MSNRRLVVGSALVVLGLVGCAKDDSNETRQTLTERQKDSLIARSPIPGAKAVGKSMNVADSASARAQRAVDTSQ